MTAAVEQYRWSNLTDKQLAIYFDMKVILLYCRIILSEIGSQCIYEHELYISASGHNASEFWIFEACYVWIDVPYGITVIQPGNDNKSRQFRDRELDFRNAFMNWCSADATNLFIEWQATVDEHTQTFDLHFRLVVHVWPCAIPKYIYKQIRRSPHMCIWEGHVWRSSSYVRVKVMCEGHCEGHVWRSSSIMRCRIFASLPRYSNTVEINIDIWLISNLESSSSD